jgi:hypothetical protein
MSQRFPKGFKVRLNLTNAKLTLSLARIKD